MSEKWRDFHVNMFSKNFNGYYVLCDLEFRNIFTDLNHLCEKILIVMDNYIFLLGR